MAKGQLHSTGTICKAEKSCPLESSDGPSHFDSIGELLEHTAKATATDPSELRTVLASGVGPAEMVSMAKEGILGSAAGASISKAPKRPATIRIDLSNQSSDSLKERFLANLVENGFPVVSAEDDGIGMLTVTVEAEADPDDYSVLMAASASAEAAAYEIGMDDEEHDEFTESLDISAELDEAPATQSVSWSYEGNDFTTSGLTAEEAQTRKSELKAEGIEASVA